MILTTAAATPWRAALAEVAALLLPAWCAGCDEPGSDLCPACSDEIVAAVARKRQLPGLAVSSALSFDGVAARAVRALKEDGRTVLARPLGRALAAAVRDTGAGEATLLVPVPASRASMRRRGYAVVELLARHSGHAWAPLLRTARTAADQRGLGSHDRAHNVAGTLRAVRAAAGASVVIVDDVVTTGATLLEARRALEAAGARVHAAAAVADTPRRFAPAIRS